MKMPSLLCTYVGVLGAILTGSPALGETLLDHTFGTGGRVITHVGFNTMNVAITTAIQPDGKILVGGEVATGEDIPRRFGLVRYLPDGSLDLGFGSGGFVSTALLDFGTPTVRCLAVQPDGKILAAGNNVKLHLVRYLPDGSLDPSFNGSDKFTGRRRNTSDQFMTRGLALQSDGKIVVCGTRYYDPAGTADNLRGYIACHRYNSDGTPDTTFNGTGEVELALGDYCYAEDVTIQGDGRIVLACDIRYFTMPRQMNAALVRLLPDGTLDTTFNGSGVAEHRLGSANSRATSLILQPDGRIVIGGGLAVGPGEQYYNERHNMMTARYNADGSLDTSFNGTGFNMADFGSASRNDVENVLLQGDRIVLIGTRHRPVQFVPNASDFAMVRFDTNGLQDPTFNLGGLALTDFNKGHDYSGGGVVQADGKIVAAGHSFFPTSNPHGSELVLARYNLDGATTPEEDDGGGIGMKGPPTINQDPLSQVVPLGGVLNVYCSHGGAPPFTYQWFKNGKPISGATRHSYSIPIDVTNADAGKYNVRITNAKGTRTSKPASVAIIDTEPLDLEVELGYPTPISARVVVPPGSPVKYQWHFNGEPLKNGAKVQGVKTATLKLAKPSESDEGVYSCLVQMGNGAVPSDYNQSDTFVTIVPADVKPVMNPVTLATATVNDTILETIVAANGPRSFTAQGLPPGIKLDAATGALSGSPTRAKIAGGVPVPYLVTFTASNHAGKSAPLVVPWLILPVPASLAGTYQALVSHNAALMGPATAAGSNLRLTVTNQGVLTGVLTLGRQSLRFTSTFSVDAGGESGSGQVTLKRPGKQGPLTLSLTLDGIAGQVSGNLTDGGALTVFSGARQATAKVAAR